MDHCARRSARARHRRLRQRRRRQRRRRWQRRRRSRQAADQGRRRDRHRRPQRPLVQLPRQQGRSRTRRTSSASRRACCCSKSNADYVPNLTTLAQQQYDIDRAGRLPDGRRDQHGRHQGARRELRDRRLLGDRAEGQAEERRGPALRGAGGGLPGRLPRRPVGEGQQRQGRSPSVGGQKIPPVDHYIAGYQAGAKAANPEIKTLNAYSQDFVDQAKCKELALDQIAKGSKVVFQVAGGCGLGALDAAKEKGVQGIGVDADQAYLGDAHPDQRAEAGRRGRVQRDQARAGRHVQGRHRRDRQRRQRRRRASARSARRARSTPTRSRRSRTRSPRARSRTSRTRSSSGSVRSVSADAPRSRATRHHQEFGPVVANDGIDFDLRRARSTRCSARTGPGKSTLMSILYGLYHPDAGEILVDGEPVTIDSPSQGDRARHRHGAPALHARPGDDRDREHRARRRAAQARRPAGRARGRARGCASCRSATAWRSTPTP